MHPGEDTPASPHHDGGKREQESTDVMISKGLLYGELATGKRVISSSPPRRLQKGHKGDGHGHRKIGRRRQQSFTLETRFTPRDGAGEL